MERKITVRAVSPGELKNDVADITYGIHRSPFGWCTLGITKRGICHLSFMKRDTASEAVRNIKESWPHAQLTRDDVRTKTYIEKIFGGVAPNISQNSARDLKRPLPLLIKGTNFQIKVWEALLKIPKGKTKSYAAIARTIGSPKAVRAVGTACGKNSIAYLIPCHRVLSSTGGIGGYRSGIDLKKAILATEQK